LCGLSTSFSNNNENIQTTHSETFQEWVSQRAGRRVVDTSDKKPHTTAYAFGTESEVRAKFGNDKPITIEDVTDSAPLYDLQPKQQQQQQQRQGLSSLYSAVLQRVPITYNAPLPPQHHHMI